MFQLCEFSPVLDSLHVLLNGFKSILISVSNIFSIIPELVFQVLISVQVEASKSQSA
jgi:hypothetical protein